MDLKTSTFPTDSFTHISLKTVKEDPNGNSGQSFRQNFVAPGKKSLACS